MHWTSKTFQMAACATTYHHLRKDGARAARIVDGGTAEGACCGVRVEGSAHEVGKAQRTDLLVRSEDVLHRRGVRQYGMAGTKHKDYTTHPSVQLYRARMGEVIGNNITLSNIKYAM